LPLQPQYFSACFNQISEGIIIADQDGRIEACNTAIERIFGVTEAEIVRQPAYQVIFPEQYQTICQKWASHQLKSLSTRKKPKTFRFTTTGANQQPLPVVCTIASEKSEGRLGVIITVQDVSERQLLETNQYELEHRLRRESLMRHLAQVINESLDLHEIMSTAANEVGKFFDVERALVYRYFFHPDTQVIEDVLFVQYCARPDVEPVTEEDIQQSLVLTKSAYQSVPREALSPYAGKRMYKNLIKIPSLEERIRYWDRTGGVPADWKNEHDDYVTRMAKKYQFFSMLGAGIEYKGIVYGNLSIVDSNAHRQWTEDEHALLQFVADQLGGAMAQSELYTREQHARQEAEIANRRKSEFLGMMSHELRTPLNAIIGYSDMTLNGLAGPLSKKQTTYLRNVYSSGKHLLDIVNDLLDVSQVETGHLAIYPVQFELKPLLETIQTMMQEMAVKKQVELVFDIDPSLNTLTADPARVKQILINLLNNAIKFNRPQGSVFLRLYKSLDQQWLIGGVEDTGIGIPQEKQANLFTKFYQVDARIARTHEGTGLGLALAKELVERHGGEIQINSIEGQGSTFTFKLPLQAAT
jgi:PAS domain S-box-containing protein